MAQNNLKTISAEHKFLRLRELAERFEVNPRTVRRWTRHYGLECRKIGGQLYIPVAAWEEFQNRKA